MRGTANGPKDVLFTESRMKSNVPTFNPQEMQIDKDAYLTWKEAPMAQDLISKTKAAARTQQQKQMEQQNAFPQNPLLLRSAENEASKSHMFSFANLQAAGAIPSPFPRSNSDINSRTETPMLVASSTTKHRLTLGANKQVSAKR